MMLNAKANLIGLRFNRLVVLESADRVNYQARWKCQCDCGNTTTVDSYNLRRGAVKSCGCLRAEVCGNNRRTHGCSHKSGLYTTWRSMLARCNNQNNARYLDYGGRGIRVSERWLDFNNFALDMGESPSPEHTLDRIDNDGDYCKGNCRWATWSEQMNNTRANRVISVGGVSRTMQQWARIMGIEYTMLRSRIQRGWPPEKALFQPSLRSKQNL